MKTSLLLSLLYLACVSIIAMAQDFSSLLNKIENSVKSQEPDWKLIEKDLREKEVIYQWKWDSGKHGARVLIFYEASEKEAAEKMASSISRISVGPDAKLNDLGDEAYLWKGQHSGFSIIRFRKSNVYIDVGAPSVNLVEKLARQIADLIPSK